MDTIKKNLQGAGISAVIICMLTGICHVCVCIAGMDLLTGTVAAEWLTALPCIAIYHKISQSATNNKKLRKLRFTTFLALTILLTYFSLEMFEYAARYFPKVSGGDNGIIPEGYNVRLALILVTFIAPIAEEIITRLAIYTIFRNTAVPVWAALISGTVFGCLHDSIEHKIISALFGAFLALSYELSGKFAIPVLGHIFYNMMVTSGIFPLFAYKNTFLMILYVCIYAAILVYMAVRSEKSVPDTKKGYAET